MEFATTKNRVFGADSQSFPKDYLSYLVTCAVAAVIGFILGVCIDVFVAYLQTRFYANGSKTFYAMVQILFNITVVYIVKCFATKHVGWGWLASLEGFFFVSTFLNTQTKGLANLAAARAVY